MNYHACLLITILLLNTVSARAGLDAISVDGPVYPLTIYFDLKQVNAKFTKPIINGASNIADMVQFPLATSSLISGKASTRRITHRELTQPFFLVGSNSR